MAALGPEHRYEPSLTQMLLLALGTSLETIPGLGTVAGIQQVRNLERIAKALAAVGLPVLRYSPPGVHPDRYMLEILGKRGEIVNVAAPMGLESFLTVSAPKVGIPATAGPAHEILRIIRNALGLIRR